MKRRTKRLHAYAGIFRLRPIDCLAAGLLLNGTRLAIFASRHKTTIAILKLANSYRLVSEGRFAKVIMQDSVLCVRSFERVNLTQKYGKTVRSLG